MSKRADPSPIPYMLVTVALLIGGYLWFYKLKPAEPDGMTRVPIHPLPAQKTAASKAANSQPTFPLPASVPSGTQIRMDGSTSMVTINQALKAAFERQFPGAIVVTQANGSNRGIQALLAGETDIAAISRPLLPEEVNQGLQAISIASDPIALVVGVNNPFQGELTSEQVEGIFKGTITNWSSVGGATGQLRVINRPAVSGTHQAFKELVLRQSEFGTTPNITTLKIDATTPLLRELANDGIGYATYAQVVNQKTVRPVAINGLLPNHPDYPYNRTLYYVYKQPPGVAVKAFLGYATSAQGQRAIFRE